MNEVVVVIFFGLLTKGAKAAIFSPTPPQSIRRPKSILQDEPSMVLHFRPWSFLYIRFREE
jgi:hypothetical protein